MIVIEPNAFYTRSDLEDLLEGSGVNVDTFIGRLRPRKVFNRLFGGKDLLEAYERVETLAGANRTVTSSNTKARVSDRHHKSDRRSVAGRKLAREFLHAKDAADE